MKFKTAWKMKAQTQVLNLWGLLLVILWLNKECTLSWIMISIHIKEGYSWIVIHIKVAFFLKITIHIKVRFFKVIIHIKVDFFKIMIHIKEGSSWNMWSISKPKNLQHIGQILYYRHLPNIQRHINRTTVVQGRAWVVP